MTPRMEFTLGVDLAQNSLRAAAAWVGADPERWRRLPAITVEHRSDSAEAIGELAAWMSQRLGQAICVGIVVESTGRFSRRFADQARRAGLAPVAIVNPGRVKAYRESLGVREKTDAADAAMLAFFGLERRPKPSPRDEAREKLRALTRLRESYLRDRTMWSNRLAQADSRLERETIERTIKHLDGQIARLEAEADRAMEAKPEFAEQCRRLEQIDGIGPVTARTITAELGDLGSFARNSLAAAAGVFPQAYESGESVRKPPRLAKAGGGRLRRVLYMAATSLMNSRGPWRPYIEKMKRRAKRPMQIIGALMRKLLLVARAVMKGGGRYDPSLIGRFQISLA